MRKWPSAFIIVRSTHKLSVAWVGSIGWPKTPGVNRSSLLNQKGSGLNRPCQKICNIVNVQEHGFLLELHCHHTKRIVCLTSKSVFILVDYSDGFLKQRAPRHGFLKMIQCINEIHCSVLMIEQKVMQNFCWQWNSVRQLNMWARNPPTMHTFLAINFRDRNSKCPHLAELVENESVDEWSLPHPCIADQHDAAGSMSRNPHAWTCVLSLWSNSVSGTERRRLGCAWKISSCYAEGTCAVMVASPAGREFTRNAGIRFTCDSFAVVNNPHRNTNHDVGDDNDQMLLAIVLQLFFAMRSVSLEREPHRESCVYRPFVQTHLGRPHLGVLSLFPLFSRLATHDKDDWYFYTMRSAKECSRVVTDTVCVADGAIRDSGTVPIVSLMELPMLLRRHACPDGCARTAGQRRTPEKGECLSSLMQNGSGGGRG